MGSKVCFINTSEIEKIGKLLPKFVEPVGIKAHFGEEGNTTYVPAVFIKQAADMVNNPRLIECGVLYRSPRSTAKGHAELALKHGFDFAPLDFLDGAVGDDYGKVKISGKHFSGCYLGKGLANYKSLLVASHFKGHAGSGFGGALKNIGMGLASRQGKLAMHASIKHQVKKNRCLGCGDCIRHCPVSAISFDENQKADINQTICVSCSKCIAVCPAKAIRVPWESTGLDALQERIAEYALAATTDKQCFYINFLINITADCDCLGKKMEKLTDDIGILVSADPVAIDQASYDLVIKQYPDFKEHNGDWQLKHAVSLGLGSRQYELIKL